MGQSGRPKTTNPKIEELSSHINRGDYSTAKTTLSEFGIDCEDSYGRTALINAVVENKPDFVTWLLDNNSNVNHQDNIGYTALHYAAQFNLHNITETLLNKGANPNIPDKYGNIPLWVSMFNSKLEICKSTKLLLKHNSNYNLQNKYDKTPSFMFKTFYNADIESVNLNDT